MTCYVTITSNGHYNCSPYDLLAFNLSEINQSIIINQDEINSSEIKQVEGNELTNQSSGDEYCVKFILLLLHPLGFTLDK